MVIDRQRWENFDWCLFAILALIGIAGLVVLYSAGYSDEGPIDVVGGLLSTNSMPFFKQLTFWLFGLLVMLATMCIPTKFLHKISYVSYILVISLLIAVLIFGTYSHGAKRWFDFNILRFQPSELMKLVLILVMARFLSSNLPEEGGYGFKQLIAPAFLVLLPMGLIIEQPDLGTSLVVAAIGFGMLLFVGIKIKALLVIGSLGIGSVVMGWLFVFKEYQKRRVMTLFDQSADELGSGYHIIQSEIAVGSGSLFGRGMLQGTQSQLEFLPEHTTDFIFSVLAEEWGFVGCLIVLTLFLFLLCRMLHIARHCKDLFSALVVVGITILLAFHVFVNIGMVIGILPVVGIPLPFFSYGGSSLLTGMFLLGLVLSIGMQRNNRFN